MQLQLCFGFQAVQFLMKTSKILYTALYLHGVAAEWFAGYLEDYLDNITIPDNMGNEAKEIFRSFDNFKRVIIRIYGDPNQYKKGTVDI